MPCKGPEEPCKWWVAEPKEFLVVDGEGRGREREEGRERKGEGEGEGRRREREREEEKKGEGEGEGEGKRKGERGRRRERGKGRSYHQLHHSFSVQEAFAFQSKKKAIKFVYFPHYTVYGIFNKPGLLLLSLDNRRSQLYDREPSF